MGKYRKILPGKHLFISLERSLQPVCLTNNNVQMSNMVSNITKVKNLEMSH